MRRVTGTVTRLSPSPDVALALSIFEAKQQRRLSQSSISMDDLLETWIIAATEHFQEQTGRQVITAPFEYWLDAFPPCDRFIEIPRAPLQAVQALEYLDGDGAWTEFDAANYTVQAPHGTHCVPGRIVLNAHTFWPIAQQQERAIKISFTAGYCDTSDDVPRLIRAALMFLVGHFHKNGEEVVAGPDANNLQKVPLGASAIIEAFRNTALPTQAPWKVSWLD